MTHDHGAGSGAGAEAETLTAEAFVDRAKEAARSQGLHVWEDVPLLAEALAVGRPGTGPEEFVALASQLGAKVLYTALFAAPTLRRGLPDHVTGAGSRSAALMFALDGIQHWVEYVPDGPDPDRDVEDDPDYRGPVRVNVSLRSDDLDDEYVHEDGDGDEDGRVESYDYMDFRSYPPKPLDARLRAMVDQVVADPGFDDRRGGGGMGSAVVDAVAADLDFDDRQKVGEAASRIFRRSVGRRLDDQARALAEAIVRLDDFHPLMDSVEIDGLAEAQLADRDAPVDPRVRVRVPGAVNMVMWDRGLYDQAHRDAQRRAAALLEQLPADVRDELGFATRVVTRDALLAPYLEQEHPHARSTIAGMMRNLEGERFAMAREARYATASRILTAAGLTRSAVSRELGISTTVMNRIEGAHRRDVELSGDDPLLLRSARLRAELRG